MVKFNTLVLIIQLACYVCHCQASSNWSVELASVTTLPPPSEMLVSSNKQKLWPTISSKRQQQQQQQQQNSNQDSIVFDDAPSPPALKLAQQQDKWTPTQRVVAQAKNDDDQQALAANLIDLMQLKQPNHITLEALAKYLASAKVQQQSSVTNYNNKQNYYLPGATPVSPEILQRALAIASNQKSPFAQPKKLKRRQTSELATPTLLSAAASDYVTTTTFNSNNNNNQQQQQQPPVYDPNASYIKYHFSSPPESRSSKFVDSNTNELDSMSLATNALLHTENLLGSSSRYLTPTIYLAPASSAFVGGPTSTGHLHHHHPTQGKLIARHGHSNEKALLQPIIVGVLAALISFLILSNLFLSLPLLAMTIFQLFNNNAAMLIPGMGGNQMPANNQNNGQNGNQMPMPNNGANGGNNSNFLASGRRRKREISGDKLKFGREDEYERILEAIDSFVLRNFK